MARRGVGNTTDISSAQVVHSGSGNVFIGGSFVPRPVPARNRSNLPNRHPHFVGRQSEMARVLEALRSRAWVVSIDGMGGIGKTTLALEVAHVCKDRVADYGEAPLFRGFVWLSARDRPDFGLDRFFEEVTTTLAPKGAQPTSPGGLAKSLLAKSPCLVIVDNFESVRDEALLLFLRDELPSPSKVLVTSRHHLQVGERVVNLHGLDRVEAVNLLKLEAERLSIPLGPTDAARLDLVASTAHGVPLVLRWAMENVRAGRSLDWVIDALQHATADDIFDFMYARSLSELDSVSEQVFTSLSVFGEFASIRQIVAVNQGVSVVPDRLSALVARSLVEDNQRLLDAERRFRLHPFTRYLADRRLNQLSDKGAALLELALQVLCDAIPELPPEKVSLHADDLTNIEYLVERTACLLDQQLLHRCIVLLERLRASAIEPRRRERILSSIGRAVRQANHPQLAIAYLQSAPMPYKLGAPVYDAGFFGRTDEIEWIRRKLNNARGGFISLIGPRRIGKTSLLLKLATDTLVNEWACVFIDVQGITSETADAFLKAIIRSTSRATGVLFETNNEWASHEVESYMLRVAEHIRPRKLLLLIDEIDLLAHNVSNFNNLRYLLQRDTFALITAGASNLADASEADLASPLWNIALTLRLEGLKSAEAVELVTASTRGILDYEPAALEKLIQMMGGYPMLLNMAATEILEYSIANAALTVTESTVDDVIAKVGSSTSYGFMHYILESAPELLRAIVAAARSPGEIITEEVIINQLGVDYRDDDRRSLKKELLNLERVGALLRIDRNKYRIGLPFLWHRLRLEGQPQ